MYSLQRTRKNKINDLYGRGTPYNRIYGDALPVRDTFLRLEVDKTVGISRVEVYQKVPTLQ